MRIAQRNLVGVLDTLKRDLVVGAGLLILHVEDLLARPQEFLRRAMAVQAPFHLQRIGRIHQRHLVHLPMAAEAADAFVDVNAVIEINEVGQIVDPGPDQRLAGTIALPHRLQHGCVRPDLRMAIHAGLGGRNAGEAGTLDRSMTVAAIDTVARRVVLVTERHRLSLGNVLISGIGRALHFQRCPQQHRHDHHHSDDRGARNCIRTTMEDLGHLCEAFHSAGSGSEYPIGTQVRAVAATDASALCDAHHPSE